MCFMYFVLFLIVVYVVGGVFSANWALLERSDSDIVAWVGTGAV